MKSKEKVLVICFPTTRWLYILCAGPDTDVEMFIKCYPLLCSLFIKRNNVMASVVCLGTHDTNACLIAPAEPVQLFSVKPTLRTLQVFYHVDQVVASELFVLVMRHQMCATVRGQTLDTRPDRPAFNWTDITGHLSGFQRHRRLLTSPIFLVQFQLWQGAEMGPADGAPVGSMDPPVFTDATQTEAVSTGEENRAAEPI